MLSTDRLIIHRSTKPNHFKFEIYAIQPDGISKSHFGCSALARFGFLVRHDIPFIFNGNNPAFVEVRVHPKLREAIAMWPPEQVELRAYDFWQSIEDHEKREEFLLAKAAYQAAYRNNEDIQFPDLLDTRLPLKRHQRVATSLGITLPKNSGYALFMEQRTGKTATAIAIVENLVYRRGVKTVLCVVPPILAYNWEQEFLNFTNLPDGRVPAIEFLRQTKADRIIEMYISRNKALKGNYPYMVMIVPYDTVSTSIDLLASVHWDVIICDESHWFKDPKTSRSKSLLRLRDASTYRYLLTGTPIGNKVTDLYTQMEFLEEGASETSSFKQFADETTVVRRDPSSKIDISTVLKECPRVKQMLAKRSFIVKRAEVMKDLPQKQYETRTFKMVPEQVKVYKALSQSLIAELEEDFAKGEGRVSATCILTKLLRLAQITAGYVVLDRDEEELEDAAFENGLSTDPLPQEIVHFEQNNRLDLLMETVKEAEPGHKTIIWNFWNPMIDKIYERFIQAGLHDQLIVFRGQSEYQNPLYFGPKSADVMREFNENPKYNFLLANQQSANIGLTLPGYPIGQSNPQTVCDTLIYFSYNWSYLQRAQSEDRPYEINSTHTVKVIDIMCEHTIDQQILKALKSKKDMSNSLTDLKDVFEALKEI